MKDMEGTPVTEEEVATGLGFASVQDMRRWETEMGQKVWDLEEKFRRTKMDADTFQWHIKRMMIVFKKVAEFLKDVKEDSISGNQQVEDLLLAIGVVTHVGENTVDWDKRIMHWFDELNPRKQSNEPDTGA